MSFQHISLYLLGKVVDFFSIQIHINDKKTEMLGDISHLTFNL